MESKIESKKQFKSSNPELLEYKSFPISARELERYDRLYSKASEILLKDFDRMSRLMGEYNKNVLEARIKIDKIGQWQGFGISVLMIVSAVVCAFLGRETVGTALVGATTLGIIKAILPKK